MKTPKTPIKKLKGKRILYLLCVIILIAGAVFLVKRSDKAIEVVKKVKVPAVFKKFKPTALIDKFKKKKAEEDTEKTPTEPEPRIIPVKIFKATKTAFKDTLPVLGSIKSFREVDLKFETNGMLESFNFEEGERVEEGDIIANLNQRDALLKLEYANIEVQKNEKLFNIGAIIEAEAEKARLEYESAKSDFEKTNIYAPRDGFLGQKHSEEGEYVTPSDKVATFFDIESVYAEFGIIEKDIHKVTLGQKIEVFVDAYPDRSYTGVVDQISPVIEGKSRTQTVKAKLKNKGEVLKPGMFTRGVIATYEKKNALLIPRNALKQKDPGFFVYIIQRKETEDEESKDEIEYGTVEVRDVKVEYPAPDYAEIGKGLKEGEFVAVEVRDEFKDKQKVEIKEVQESPF